MRTSHGFTTNDLYNGTNLNHIDDMQPPMRGLSPRDLRSDHHVYQNYETRNPDRYQNYETRNPDRYQTPEP